MNWWVVGLGGLAALAAVVVAFLVDRDSAKRRRDTLAAPPDRPALAPLATPLYVTPDAVKPARVDLSGQARAAIDHDLAAATAIEAGWASADFVTDQPSGWAVLDEPLVLVAEAVTSVRALYPVVERAKAAATGLVVVAETVDTSVVATLALNALSGTLSCLVIRTTSVQEVASATQGTVVSAADLQADYLPEGCLGHCQRWVASHDQSWIWPVAQPQPSSSSASSSIPK